MFHHQNLHQKTRWENETIALEHIDELRDDFALRGRCEMYRVDLQSMASAHQLHQGTNLRHHLIWAEVQPLPTTPHHQEHHAPEEDMDVIQFFDEHHDPNLFMERHALKRSSSGRSSRP